MTGQVFAASSMSLDGVTAKDDNDLVQGPARDADGIIRADFPVPAPTRNREVSSCG